MDAEMRTYLDGMRQETRRDLAEAMAASREETRRDLAEAMAASREETRRDLAEAMATLRAEMRAEAGETRRHFDVVAEGMRRDVRLVAEGVIANTEAIGRLRTDIGRDMDERFHVVHLAFADLRRDIGGRPRPR